MDLVAKTRKEKRVIQIKVIEDEPTSKEKESNMLNTLALRVSKNLYNSLEDCLFVSIYLKTTSKIYRKFIVKVLLDEKIVEESSCELTKFELDVLKSHYYFCFGEKLSFEKCQTEGTLKAIMKKETLVKELKEVLIFCRYEKVEGIIKELEKLKERKEIINTTKNIQENIVINCGTYNQGILNSETKTFIVEKSGEGFDSFFIDNGYNSFDSHNFKLTTKTNNKVGIKYLDDYSLINFEKEKETEIIGIKCKVAQIVNNHYSSIVYTNDLSLNSALKIVDNEWIEVKTKSSKGSILRWARCKTIDNVNYNGCSVAVSSCLALNSGLEIGDEIELISTRINKLVTNEPPLLKEVELRIVSSLAQTKANLNLAEKIMWEHFASNKVVVCSNDIVEIVIKESEIDLLLFYAHNNEPVAGIRELQYDSCCSLFLKIVDAVEATKDQAVSGSGGEIDVIKTKVKLNGLTNEYCRTQSTEHLLLENKISKFFKTTTNIISNSNDFELINLLVFENQGANSIQTVEAISKMNGFNFTHKSIFELVHETIKDTKQELDQLMQLCFDVNPCVLCLTELDYLHSSSAQPNNQEQYYYTAELIKFIDNISEKRSIETPVVIVGIAENANKLCSELLCKFSLHINTESSTIQDRAQKLKELRTRSKVANDLNVEQYAALTASLTNFDLEFLINESIKNSKLRMNNMLKNNTYTMAVDIEKSLEKLRSNQVDSIGLPKIPDVSWDDVGGLISIKQDILDTIQLPLTNPELFHSGIKKRSGVLLYGPPGTGKTMVAKAVASSCALNFFSVKGPELLNMYIGESEANVRNIFKKARECSPCVIFFDELDSIAPKRGQFGDSGGVMDRIVSQLLTEIDGLCGSDENENTNVFVIGATNRPDLLDSALLRPGRFDKLLYLGVAQNKETQYKIIEALTRKFELEEKLDLKKVVEKCPFNFTGADFYALCSDAMLNSIYRLTKLVDDYKQKNNSITLDESIDQLETKNKLKIKVCLDDFLRALDSLKPSVSIEELDQYRKLQQKFGQ